MSVRRREPKMRGRMGRVERPARGSPPLHERLGLSLDDVVAMYRTMLQMRLISDRYMQLNRMGRAPFAAAADGHEAAQVGSAWAIRKGVDWCVPYYRDLGVALVLGQSALDMFLGLFAKATDPNSGGRQVIWQFSDPGRRILTGSVCIATQFPHACGIALAAKIRGEELVVFAYGGDGATSPGDFHEALNWASTHSLPVVFVIENNHFAISTPLSLQMRVRDVAERAAGYGMPGIVADGTAVLDVYAKTKQAAERARRGEGPSLVEVKCYRFRPHSTDDDDRRYRTKEELDWWLSRDPIDRAASYLRGHGASDERLDGVRTELAADIERAIVEAEAAPDPDPADALRHVYSS